MEKKFLDKQGLVELNESFKDKFARKSDVPVKASQLENDENYLKPDTFLDSLCDSGNGFDVPNVRVFPLIDVLKNPAQINKDWNNIILTNGVKAYLSIGVLNSPNGNGMYIVFTSIRLVEKDNDEVYENFVGGRLQPFIVAFHLETGRVFKRTFQPNLENNSSLHLVHFDEWFVNGYTAKEWSSWEEVTKDFVMKDQFEKALSEKVNKSDILYKDITDLLIEAIRKSKITSEYETVDGFADERVASQKAVHDLYQHFDTESNEIWNALLTTAVVDKLPEKGNDNVLYLVKNPNGKESNSYLEYLWIENKFELIGSPNVDLSQYVNKDELSSYAKSTDIKTKLSELTDDPTHRTVTDSEKAKIQNIPDNARYTDTTYDNATPDKAGLMSAEDKKKLDNMTYNVFMSEKSYNELSSEERADKNRVYFISKGDDEWV